MDLDEFRIGLLNDVETRAESEGDFILSAFVGELSQRMAEAEVIENLDPLHFRGVGRKNRNLGVDGFDLDDADESIALAIAYFSGINDPTPPRLIPSEARRVFGLLEAFLEESANGDFIAGREESTREYGLALDLRNRGRAPSRYRLYLLTDYLLSDQTREFTSSDVNGIPVDFHVWDIRRFWELQTSAQGREPLEIDLREWNNNGLPALKVVGDAGFTTYLAAIPGAMLADLYHRHGSRLLESNVRSYLTARGKINKGIQTTVHSAPHMFLAYNNGITATATGVRTNANGAIEAITDLQVVNGGQTTASLFYVRRDPRHQTTLSGIHVQMKLVVVEPQDATELVPNISRFANSQNRVSEADFFSNSPFHVRLEELSRRLLAPQSPGRQYQNKWYYERTRGQYQNDRSKLSTGQQKQFDLSYPRGQVITKTDAAKYEVSWDQKPHLVSAGAQKNFMAFADSVAKRWADSPESFNEQYFRDLVAKAILFNEVRYLVAKQDWYEKGYLANIVSYTLAKLSYEVARQVPNSRMNFRRIWDKQSTPPAILEQCLVIAKLALATLTAATRPVQNVTEWAKREDAWKRLREASIPLAEDFKATLLSEIAVRDMQSAAKTVQKTDSGIRLQMVVVQTPMEEWQDLLEYCNDNGLGTTMQRSILSQLMSGRVPSDRQAAVLVELVKTAKSLGYSSRHPEWALL